MPGKSIFGRFRDFLTGRDTSPYAGPGGNVAAKSLSYTKMQQASMDGHLSTSRQAVAFYTLDEELRTYVAQEVAPAIRAAGCEFIFNPKPEKALNCKFLLMDGTMKSDARLHSTYDKVIRQKKSMQKSKDVLAVIAPRDDVDRYPRGTYPGLLFFVYDPADPLRRDPEIPETGQPIPAGPVLHNFADMVEAFKQKII